MTNAPIPPSSTALVTGGGGGVGRAVAAALEAAGYQPVLMGRRREPLEAAAAAIGGSTVYEVADVTDRGAVEEAVARVTETLGAPLIVINGAGIAESSPLLPPDDDLWDRTMAINAKGAYIVATACLPAMKEAGSGFIANVASTAALQGSRYTVAYVASKHAMLGTARAMAEDLARTDIRVATVCPGFLDTPMTERTVANITAKTGMSAENARQSVADMNPSKRLIHPDEVAAEIMRLLADPGAHGAEVRLD